MKMSKKKKDEYVTPIRSYIDESGSWFIEFNKKDIIKIMNYLLYQHQIHHPPNLKKYLLDNL